MIRRLAGEQGKAATATTVSLSGWLVSRFRRGGSVQPRLALLERITLAPRQTLALVEAEGRRLLVATSPDGAPTFYALDGNRQQTHLALGMRQSRRISW
jgi:flagellar biogenesis protein FliO